MIKLIMACGWFACFLPQVLAAQAVVPTAGTQPLDLDLKTAVALAWKNDYSLMGAQAELNAKSAAAQSAWSLFYPTVGLTGAFQTGLTDPDTPSAARNRLSVGLSAGLTVDPTLAFDVKRLWNDYESGLASYGQAKARLETTVRKYYYNLRLQTQQLDLLRKQAEAAAQRLETARFRFEHGFMSEIDKLVVEYAYLDKLYALQSMENGYAVNLRQLTDVCGFPAGRAVNLVDPIPETAAPAFDPAAVDLSRNPDLKALYLNKSLAEIQRDEKIAGLWPTLSVGGKLSGGWGADPFSSSLFDGAAWSWAGSLSLSVNLTVPLDAYLPSSPTRLSLDAQEAAVLKLSYGIADQERALKRQAQTLILTLSQIKSQIDSLLVNASLARRSLSLVEELYGAGKKSFSDLRDAENNAYGAQVQLFNARYNYAAAALDLGYLLSVDVGF